MPATDPGLCRVSIQCGTTAADVALPTGIPVAALTPSIVDILEIHDTDGGPSPKRYHLSLAGMPALDPSKTLGQSGIRDGTVLLLTQSSTPPPAPRHHDVAVAMSATLEAAARPGDPARRRSAARIAGAVAACSLVGIGGSALIRNVYSASLSRDLRATVGVTALAGFIALLSATIVHRVYQDAVAGLTLNVLAIVFAAVAGFIAVPGAPGVGNVLLAATAAAATSVLAMRGCGVVALAAVACAALVVAVAALVGVLTNAPLPAIGAVSATISLGLLGIAARASIVLAGLSPRLPPTPDADDGEKCDPNLSARTLRADNWLSSLLGGFSSSAALGAVVTVLAGAPRLSCMVFGGITGALLLLRSRSGDSTRTLTFAVSGFSIVATTFGVAAFRAPGHGPWVVTAAATLSGAAICLGFVAPAITLSPLARRCAESLEWLALAAIVPLTVWIWGLYAAARGFSLP